MSAAAPETVEAFLRQSFVSAIGGARGAIDAAVPPLAFTIAWTLTQTVSTSLICAGAALAVVAAARLVARQTLRYAAYAAAALAIAAFFALRSGRGEDAFLPNIWTNAAYGAICLLSVLARWPLVGFVVAGADRERLTADPTWWRRVPGILSVSTKLTWVLVAMYAVRLSVAIPLYLSGQVTALGIARLALGWPLYLGAIAVMASILVRGHTPLEPAPIPPER